MKKQQAKTGTKPEQEESQAQLHDLEITYKIDGEVIKVIRRQIDEKYRWFLLGNMSWREW